jgi:hypothetical protein
MGHSSNHVIMFPDMTTIEQSPAWDLALKLISAIQMITTDGLAKNYH